MRFTKPNNTVFHMESNFSLEDIGKEIVREVNKEIGYINRMAPRVFRKAIGQTLAMDPDLKHFAKTMSSLRTENRPIGKAHAGTGLSIKIQDRVLVTSMQLFDGYMMSRLGRDDFWKLKVLTEGQYTISLKAGIPQPYRVDSSDKRSVGEYDEGKGRAYESKIGDRPTKTGVAFHRSKSTKKITRASRRSDWLEQSEKLAVEELIKKINQRR